MYPVRQRAKAYPEDTYLQTAGSGCAAGLAPRAEQVFYYDEQLMQRRSDYSPYVTGSPPVAHYTHDPENLRRLRLPDAAEGAPPRRRWVADQSFAPITLDIDSVEVEPPR